MKAAALTAAAFVCLTFQPQSASAQAEILMMRLCKRVTDDAARLKCFDAIGAETAAKADEKPKSAPPQWDVQDSKSPIDDSPQVSATLASDDGKAALAVRCQEKKTEAALLFDSLFVFEKGAVLLRLNDLPAASAVWGGSSTNKALFAPSGTAFLKMLPNDGTLFVRATGHSRSQDATFQLGDIATIRQRISVACKWKDSAPSTAPAQAKKPAPAK